LAALGLCLGIGESLLGAREWGWALAFLVSSSNLVQKFCATLQYEVPLLCLLAAFIWLNCGRAGPRLRDAASVAVLSLLCLFSRHYLILAALWLPWRLSLRAPSGMLGPALAAALAVLLASNYAYHRAVLREGDIRVRAEDSPRDFLGYLRARKLVVPSQWLHSEAAASNWPLRPPREPAGLRFILEQPGRYTSLAARRFMLLFGAGQDPWSIAPYPVVALARILGRRRCAWGDSSGPEYCGSLYLHDDGALSLPFGLGFFALFLLGAAAAWKRSRFAALLCLLPLAPIFTAALVIGSSPRFLIPVYVPVAILQLYAVKAFAERRAGNINC
jgi:hypothetical protein